MARVEIPLVARVEIPLVARVEIPLVARVEMPLVARVEIPLAARVEMPLSFTEQLERLSGGGRDGLIPETHQSTDGGRRGVQLSHLVLVDGTPQPARVGKARDSLVDQLGRSVEERAIRDI